MFYVLIFAGIAILLVVAYVVQQGRRNARTESPEHRGAASHTPKGSAARRERKRRRAQSAHDRRKPH